MKFKEGRTFDSGKEGKKTEHNVTFTNVSRYDVVVRWKWPNETGFSMSDTIQPNGTYNGGSWAIPSGKAPEVQTIVEYADKTSQNQPDNKPSGIPQALPQRNGGREEAKPKTPDQAKWEKERLTGEQVAAACNEYYATRGEWAGVFMITTINASKVVSQGGGRYTVYLKYSYLGIGGGFEGETGDDARTFDVIATDGGGCRVTGMGDYQSGNF